MDITTVVKLIHNVTTTVTLSNPITTVIPVYVDSGASPWILATGLWDDNGIWDDTAVWID